MVDTATVVGERKRRYVAGALLGLILGASVAFLVGANGLRSVWFFVPVLAIATYAGRVRAGWLAAAGSVLVTTLWWYAFGPLVGLMRGSNAERYAAPRMKDFETTVRGELRLGIESGVETGIILALVLGTLCYLGGWLLRYVDEHHHTVPSEG